MINTNNNKYKPSIFNIQFKSDNGRFFLFNTLTCALVEIDKANNKSVSQILANPNNRYVSKKLKLRQHLLNGGFLIDENYDEMSFLKFKNWSTRFSERVLGLTICPTLRCNFKCTYCYERFFPQTMNKYVMDRLVLWTKEIIKNKSELEVSWYGGEPLLCFEQIQHLTAKFMQICSLNDVKYSASLTTNGYLLNSKVARSLRKLNVKQVQITIDGPEKIHDQRRKLRSGKGTFNVILENIKHSIDYIPGVNVRVNVDKTNISYIPELLSFLEPFKKNIWLYFSATRPYTDVCTHVSNYCFSLSRSSEVVLDLTKMALKAGFKSLGRPLPRNNFCGADTLNSYVISPTGLLFKCWLEISDIKKSFGSIFSKNFNYNWIKYLSVDAFADIKCKKCSIIPLCMGGCPYYRLNTGVKLCDIMLHNLENWLLCYAEYFSAEKVYEKKSRNNTDERR